MEFRFNPLFVVDEAGLCEPVKALRVFIVCANIVGKRISPRAHARGRHDPIEGALLPLKALLQRKGILSHALFWVERRTAQMTGCGGGDAEHSQVMASGDLQLRAIRKISAVAAHADHAPPAYGVLNAGFISEEIRPLVVRHPGAISVRSKPCVSCAKRGLFPLKKAVYEIVWL